MTWDRLRVVVGDRCTGKSIIAVDTYMHMLDRDIGREQYFLCIVNDYQNIESIRKRLSKLKDVHNGYDCSYGVKSWNNLNPKGMKLPLKYDNIVIDEPNFSGLSFKNMILELSTLNTDILTVCGSDTLGMTPMKNFLMYLCKNDNDS